MSDWTADKQNNINHLIFTIVRFVLESTDNGNHYIDRAEKGGPKQNLEELPTLHRLTININFCAFGVVWFKNVWWESTKLSVIILCCNSINLA